MAQSSYQKIILTGNITLSWPFSFQEGPIIYDINNIDASPGNFKITLPDATLASPGQNILFNNISANSFQIMNNDGITNITTVSAGAVYYLYLSDVSTANGIWTPIPFGGGTSAINSVIAKSTNDTLVITGGTLTPPGGTIDFALPTSISNLTNVSVPGFLVAKTTTPLTYTTRNIIGDGNIVVNNSDGVATDPIVVLSNSLIGLTSIAVGDLQLSGNVITTNVVNGEVQLSSAGTGKVSINGVQIDTGSNISGANNLTLAVSPTPGVGNLQLSGDLITNNLANGSVEIKSVGTGKVNINNSVQIDTSGNVTGVNNLTLNGSLTITGGFSSPTSPKVIFTFTDVSGTISKLSYYNVTGISGSNGHYTITFPTLSTNNYGLTFGLGGGVGPNINSDPVINNVVWENKTATSVSIKIYDRAGVLVETVPFGVTGTIWLPT